MLLKKFPVAQAFQPVTSTGQSLGLEILAEALRVTHCCKFLPVPLLKSRLTLRAPLFAQGPGAGFPGGLGFLPPGPGRLGTELG